MSKIYNHITPTIRVWWHDGEKNVEVERFQCSTIPRVGDHIAVEMEYWPVIKVAWCITGSSVQYVDVYIAED